MCLFDKKRFRLSIKPITVYKIWLIDKNTKPYVFSPYEGCPIKKYMFGGFGSPAKCYGYMFGKGFLHAFQTLEDAKANMRCLLAIDDCKKYEILKCTIPSFVRYAKGGFGNICSRFLIVNDYELLSKL